MIATLSLGNVYAFMYLRNAIIIHKIYCAMCIRLFGKYS